MGGTADLCCSGTSRALRSASELRNDLLRAGPVSAARVYQPPTRLNPPDLVDKVTMAPRERPPWWPFLLSWPVYSLHTFFRNLVKAY